MGYTASDLLGVGLGFLLFALFAFAPGYTLASLTNIFDFRRRRFITRLTASIPISIGFTPIAAYLLWLYSLSLVWIVFGALGAICVTLVIRDARTLDLRLSRAGWLVLAISAAWIVIGALSLVDLQFGNRLYVPFASYDLSTHVAFTAAIARDGVPPHNPFFYAGLPAALRYHYFWYIPCALVERLGGSAISARLGVIAGTLWVGLGLVALIACYLRFFAEKGGAQIERRTLIAVSLLGITGLDILPVATIDIFGKILMPTIELWNEQISAWITTVIWAPHDLASLVAGLTGFLLTFEAARRQQGRQRTAGLLAGGVAFASASGASVYVGGSLAAACAVWLAIALLKRWWRFAFVLAGAGVVATILLLPFAFQLLHGSDGQTTIAAFSFPMSFSVRDFSVVDAFAKTVSPARLNVLHAVFLPLNYFLEFGFFFIVGCLAVRRIWRRGLRTQAEWAAAALAVVSLLICTFVKSTVIKNNDLGWRSALLVQFILLLGAAEMWNKGILGFGRTRTSESIAKRTVVPRLVAAALVLGASGSCYELCMQRIFPVLEDSTSVQMYSWMSNDRQLGRRTFELRRSYQQINRTFPIDDVVQADPNFGIGDLPAEMYSGRQMVADVGNCGTTFGGSKKFCNDVILPRLKPLFEDGDPITFADAEQTCREFSITALLFKDTDPVWKDKSSWIWNRPALISNDFVRVIPCGKR